MEIKKVYIRRIYPVLLLLAIVTALSFLQEKTSCTAAKKKVTGVDENGNAWRYNSVTKTMTFSGNKDIGKNYSLDGHSVSPDWHVWWDGTEHLVIEEGITGIGDGAFCDFDYLQTVTMPDTVTYLGAMSFEGCWRLQKMNLSSGITKFDDHALSGCRNVKTIIIPENTVYIGEAAFSACDSLQSIRIPEKVKTIGANAFLGCDNLSHVEIAANIKQLRDGVFFCCQSLKKFTIPESVTSVTMTAFSYTPIKKIVIPKKVETIKKGRPLLGKVFHNKKLKTVEIRSKKIKKIQKGSFSGLRKKCVIRVPKNKKKKYEKLLKKSGLSKKIKVKKLS